MTSEARRLLRGAGRASLATALEDERGVWPYASLTLAACDVDGAPLLLLSDLAVHAKNLLRDPRGSLLLDGTLGLADPLTGPRLTVLGTLAPVADGRALDRYVRRHPSAGLYRGFGDFRLWRMQPVRAQLVAGFGRISWVETSELMADAAAAADIAAAEPALLERLNQEPTLIQALATGGRLTGLDPDGADLAVGDVALRLDFPQAATGVQAAEAALRALAAPEKSARP
jgi:hypothetical protein